MKTKDPPKANFSFRYTLKQTMNKAINLYSVQFHHALSFSFKINQDDKISLISQAELPVNKVLEKAPILIMTDNFKLKISLKGSFLSCEAARF